MRSHAFENIRRKHPGLEMELRRLQDYLTDRIKAGFDEVVPPLAAEALGLSSVETLGLLMVLEDSHLLRHKYRVYCKSKDAVLLEVDEKDDLPEETYCPYCNCVHPEEGLDIEVVFKIKMEAQEQPEKTAKVV